MNEIDIVHELQEFPQENKRIQKLNELHLDYFLLQKELRGLIEMAGTVANTEFCRVNFLDSYFQWSLAAEDKRIEVIPKEESICQYTIRQNEPLEIARVDQDNRFNIENLKYYLGIPLTVSTGDNLGVLCFFDSQEKVMSTGNYQFLKTIAAEITRKLEVLSQKNQLKLKLSQYEKDFKRLAHDIRSPLSGISRLCSLIREEDYSKTEILSFMEMIVNSSDGLLELVEVTLEKHLRNKSANNHSIVEFAEQLKELYTLPARAKNLNFEVNFQKEQSQKKIMENQLFSAVGNLLSNAFKYTPSGGEVTASIIVEQREEEEFLCLTVKDNGIGFKNYDQNSPHEAHKKDKGFGLGLQLVQEVIQKCNGEIFIESMEDVGTKVKIEVPLI
jgi:signal transduction histidine kinase